MSQCHGSETMSTGGAAKFDRVPPIETLTNGCVFECFSRIEIIKFACQQKRTDGHGCRLGDQGSEQRPDGQNGQPPGLERSTEQPGDTRHDGFRQLQDRTRGSQGHDYHDEHGLGEIDPLGDIEVKGVPVIEKEYGPCKGRRPQAENDFDLSQKMEELRPNMHRMAIGLAGFDLFLVMMFPTMGNCQKAAGHKGMQNRKKKYGSRDEIEWRLLNPVFENRPQPIGLVLAVAVKVLREFYSVIRFRMTAAGTRYRACQQQEGYCHQNYRTAKASQHVKLSSPL